jgi:hypothetical protein
MESNFDLVNKGQESLVNRKNLYSHLRLLENQRKPFGQYLYL